MERVHQRLAVARRALATLAALPLDSTDSDIVRDAAIQRFEYTFEVVWKAAQRYLREVEGLAPASPKGVVRAAFQTRLLSEEEARHAMRMVEDRNLTVHTYNQELAEAIYARVPGHARLMARWLDAMSEQLQNALAQVAENGRDDAP
jgi:nucleotidyltransferase substrate binding protein (TIGR01987 family)